MRSNLTGIRIRGAFMPTFGSLVAYHFKKPTARYNKLLPVSSTAERVS